jgi:hypothetical protein
MTSRFAWVLVFSAFVLTRASSLREEFLSEAREELPLTFAVPPGYFTWEVLSALPPPVSHSLFMSGHLDNAVMRNARIVWEVFELKRKPGAGWMKLRALQFNSVPSPARFVYMETMPWSLLRYQAKDTYHEGRGRMRVRAFKALTVAEERGPEMDRSELVTVLAEAVLIPSYYLQPYVTWEPRDSLSASATLEWEGARVSGVFYFNAFGECTRFETWDRRQAGKESVRMQWIVTFGDYKELNGVLLPSTLKASWLEPGHEPFEYFRGRVRSVDFDRDSLP